MEELRNRAASFFRDNILAVACLVIGISLLIYGLISFSATSNRQDVLFESSAVDAEVRSSDVKGKASVDVIVVDVSGAVNKPGVYRLSSQSRIEDAFLAAGGVSDAADLSYIAKNVNLASLLTDGAKIYVPFNGEESQSATYSIFSGESGSVAGKASGININTASSSELKDLPGIGEVTAEKIIDSRPYASIEELLSKKIVTKRVYDQIREKVGIH